MLFLLLSLAMASDTADVNRVLDGFHEAAATADFDAYFGAMTADAVFVGTDKTERWERKAFEAFARPHFEGDSAWTYTPVRRDVAFAGEVAWFDEELTNPKYGTARGSGVLVKKGETWKIAHYVLSFPIPNDVAAEVVEIVKKAD